MSELIEQLRIKRFKVKLSYELLQQLETNIGENCDLGLNAVAKAQVGNDVLSNAPGIDSLAGAERVGSLKEKYSISLPDTLAWDYPTITQTSSFIQKIIKNSKTS